MGKKTLVDSPPTFDCDDEVILKKNGQLGKIWIVISEEDDLYEVGFSGGDILSGMYFGYELEKR